MYCTKLNVILGTALPYEQGRRDGDFPRGGGCKMKILPTEWAWQLIEFHFMNLYFKFADMPVSVLSLNVNKLQKVTYLASLKM